MPHPSPTTLLPHAQQPPHGKGKSPSPLVEWSLRRVGTTPAIDLLENALEEDRLTNLGVGDDEGLLTAALKECRSIGDGRRALRYLGMVNDYQLREIDCVSTIYACAAEGLTDEAVSVFRRLARRKRGPVRAWGPPCYVAIIVACSKGGRPEDAVAFFSEMGVNGEPAPDAACYAAMMETYRRSGRASEALALLEDLKACGMAEAPGRPAPRGSHLVLAATIRALTDLGRPAEALERFDQARGLASGVIPDGGCYGAALEAAADLGDWRRALHLIEEMGREVEYKNVRGTFVRRQLRVGRQHYVAAMRACAKAGESEQALALLRDMRTRGGVRPDEKCHRWALFACCQDAQWRRAYAMLLEGPAPPSCDAPWTLPCYTTTMRALVRVGQTEEVLALWDLLLVRGLAPDAGTGDIALSVAGKQKKWELVKAIFDELQGRGVEPYEAGIGVVIEGLCQQGQLKEALAFLRQVSAPNVIMFTSVLSGMGRAGELAGALALLEEMETKAGVTPDHVALTCLVDACLKAGDVENAGRLASRLEANALAQVDCPGQAEGMQEDERSFGVRVRTMLEQGYWEDAWRTIKDAETVEGHVPVPAMSYSVLLNAAAKEGRWRDALEMLLHMREKRGLEPSTVDLSSAINACRVGGETRTALKLLELLDLRRRARGRLGKRAAEPCHRNGGKVLPRREVAESEEDLSPYQVTYGLVLDLLARQASSASQTPP